MHIDATPPVTEGRRDGGCAMYLASFLSEDVAPWKSSSAMITAPRASSLMTMVGFQFCCILITSAVLLPCSVAQTCESHENDKSCLFFVSEAQVAAAVGRSMVIDQESESDSQMSDPCDATINSALASGSEESMFSEKVLQQLQACRGARALASCELHTRSACLDMLADALTEAGSFYQALRVQVERLDTGAVQLADASDFRVFFNVYLLNLYSLSMWKAYTQVYDLVHERANWQHLFQISEGRAWLAEAEPKGGPKAFWPASDFAVLSSALERLFPTMVEELAAAAATEEFVSHGNRGLIDKGDWQEIRLFEMSTGTWSRSRCRIFPQTCRGLQAIPEFITTIDHGGDTVWVPGRLSFLKLEPGSSLHSHTGNGNARLSIHMGISGLNNATLRVGNETRRWSPGKVIIFDDSFVHSVENQAHATSRVVFTGHFFKPGVCTAFGCTADGGFGTIGLVEDEFP